MTVEKRGWIPVFAGMTKWNAGMTEGSNDRRGKGSLKLAYDVKCFFEVYVPGVEGGADDSAFGAEGFEHFEVV